MTTRFLWELFSVFVSGVAIDFLGGLHTRGFIDGLAFQAVFTIVLIHYLAFVGALFFIERKLLSERLWITTAGATGAGLGTLFAIYI